jgi:hypothetical protein
MENVEQWSAIVGFLLPPVLAVIQQTIWKPQTKAIVAFIACIVASLGTTYFSGTLHFSGEKNIEMLSANFLILFTVAISTYEMFWKKTTIAPKIESLTNIYH